MTKKLIKKSFFSVITKNLNWVTLTKNLVTFERWDSVKDQNVIQRGLAKTREAWTVCTFKRGLGEKERSGVFEGGG